MDIKKHERVERLVLGPCGGLLLDGEIGQVLLNFGGTHFIGVTQTVKADELDDSLAAALLRTAGVVAGPKNQATLSSSFTATPSKMRVIGCSEK